MEGKKINVCLVEYKYHSEVIRSLTYFFLDSKCQVTIISNKKCLEDLSDLTDEKDLDMVLIESSKPIKSLRYNLVIYVTPFDDLQINRPVIDPSEAYLMIHNIHYWLHPGQNIYFLKDFHHAIKHGLRFFKYWNLQRFRRNRQYLEGFKGILAPSRMLCEGGRNSDRLSGYLDTGYSRGEEYTLSKNKNLTIVIPGAVTADKNPKKIIKAIRALANNESIGIDVVLAGPNRLLSRSFIHNCQSDYFTLEVFDSLISQPVYDQLIKKADLGIIAVQPFKDYKGIREKRGITNITGGIFDMMRFNKPFLVPAFYQVAVNESGIWKYENEDELISIIQEFIELPITPKTYLFKKTMEELFFINTQNWQALLAD